MNEFAVSPETLDGLTEHGGLLGVTGDVGFTDADNVGASSSDICKGGVFLNGGAEFAIDVLEGVAEVIVGVDRIAAAWDGGGVEGWVWV